MDNIAAHLPKVFVSHSWRDKRLAMEITDGLRSLNCAHVWMDFENMIAGKSIDESLKQELAKMDYMILIWTSNSAFNENVANEMIWAKQLQIPIIPCYFEFDEKGSPFPEQTGAIQGILGIEFRKMNQGLVTLFHTLQHHTKKTLPTEIKEDLSNQMTLLKKMEALNGYLVNYRNIKNTGDDRKFWISKVMDALESLKDAGGNEILIHQFMTSLGSLQTTDPEAYDAVKPRLESYFKSK